MKLIRSARIPVVMLKSVRVLEGKESHRPVHLVIIFQIVHPVVFRQCRLQRGLQAVIRRVADAEHVDSVPVQPVAELPVSMGKMRRDKNKVHGFQILYSLIINGRKYRICLNHHGQSWLTS